MAEAWVGRAVAADVEVAWRFEGETLRVGLDAPGSGWVAIGLHSRSGLSGARLVMVAERAGRVLAEEHVAQPPRHTRVRDLVARSGTKHRFEVDVPCAPPTPEGVSLGPGAAVWLTLAWSHSPDFDHHSARRGEVQGWL